MDAELREEDHHRREDWARHPTKFPLFSLGIMLKGVGLTKVA